MSSLIPKKFDDHSLIILHSKCIFDRFEGPDREDYFLKAT
jgi:hypothetical protein